MVEMYMMLEFERQKKVVLPRALRALTPRIIAGCYEYFSVVRSHNGVVNYERMA